MIYILKKKKLSNKKTKILFGPKEEPKYLFGLAQWLKYKNLIFHLTDIFPSLT